MSRYTLKVAIRDATMPADKIEKAIYLQDTPKAASDIFTRVYFGTEFCERLIPSVLTTKSILNFIKRKGKKLTFLTPYCTNYGIEKLKRVLGILPIGTEVVFNDLGVFRMAMDIKNKKFDPVLGRLLVKYKRDPRFNRLLLNKGVKKYFMSSNINNTIFQQYLVTNGFKRIEIENSLQGYNFVLCRDIHSSLYYPYTYITTTTSCIFKKNTRLPGCNFACKDSVMLSRIKQLPIEIITRGNTEYYRNPELPAKTMLKKRNIDRIVFFPRLPY